MEKVITIEDETLGILNGRECIFIETVTQDDMDNLIIKGDIVGSLARKINEDKWIPYNLIFHRVIAYFSCELDTYENIDTYDHLDYSDFNWVKNSQWLAKFPIRKDFDKSIYKHYQVFTYDYVFNIIAVSYELNCDLVNTRPIIYMTALDKLGKIFMEEIRDVTINNMIKKIDGTMKSTTEKEIPQKIIDFTDEQKDFLKYIVCQTVDNTLNSCLFMLEQHKEISLLYDDINLNEESDSLSGELDGWIEKYSAQGK